MKNLRPLLPVLLALLALTALDQWTKHAIFSQWLKGHEEHVFIKGFFSFKAVENRGIVFGLFQGAGKIPLLALTLTAFLARWATCWTGCGWVLCGISSISSSGTPSTWPTC